MKLWTIKHTSVNEWQTIHKTCHVRPSRNVQHECMLHPALHSHGWNVGLHIWDQLLDNAGCNCRFTCNPLEWPFCAPVEWPFCAPVEWPFGAPENGHFVHLRTAIWYICWMAIWCTCRMAIWCTCRMATWWTWEWPFGAPADLSFSTAIFLYKLFV